MRLTPDLPSALASLSDDDLERLLHACAAEEIKRFRARSTDRPILNAASLFKKIGSTAALLALLALPLGLTSCVLDLNKLAKDIGKPSVSFEAPSAWTCDQTTKLPTKQGIEECAVCKNATKDV